MSDGIKTIADWLPDIQIRFSSEDRALYANVLRDTIGHLEFTHQRGTDRSAIDTLRRLYATIGPEIP